MQRFTAFAVWTCLSAALAGGSGPSQEIPYLTHTIDLGRNETCAIADINGDGQPDIVSGENWFQSPDWKKHKFRSIETWNNYIDNFSDLALDVNDDGAVDIISNSWRNRKIVWWANPGPGEGEWTEHLIDSGSPVEFSFLVDLDNNGKHAELLPQFGGQEGGTVWYEVVRSGPTVKWVKHTVSAETYGHGIGAGDVNGDGRNDILTRKGWLEAPADPRQGLWQMHRDFDFEGALGFLYVHDVNRDGRNDIVTSMAHDYGVFWLEQLPAGSPEGSWKKHMIDDAWSQAHAMTLVDLTGDGRPELVTGKRLFAHNGHDPGGREPLGLYWYEHVDTGRSWEWVRHIIHYGERIGTGMQIPVVDIDADGDLDFAVGGKGGVFLFENQTIGPERDVGPPEP